MSLIFGNLIRADGTILVSEDPPTHTSQGFNLTALGAIYSVLDGMPVHFHAGLPFDANGALVITLDTPIRYDQGVPFGANGGVAMVYLPHDRINQGHVYADQYKLAAQSVNLTQKYDWTPNLDGINSYGALTTAWISTDADYELVYDVYRPDAVAANEYLADTNNVVNARLYQYLSIDRVRFPGAALTCLWDGAPATDNSIVSPLIGLYQVQFNGVTAGDIDRLACNVIGSDNWKGQHHQYSFTDNDDPSNSIRINTIINAEEMPTETIIRNSLLPDLGPELVVNGDFSNGSDNWIVTNGQAVLTPQDGGLNIIRETALTGCCTQVISTEVGKGYLLRYDFVDNSAPNIKCYTHVGGVLGDTSATGLGPKERYFVAQSATTLIEFSPGGSTFIDITIDNASVRESNRIGDWINLPAQAYVPVLKNGEPDRVTYSALKHEHYLGDYSVGDFKAGVDAVAGQMTSLGIMLGSWKSLTALDDIIVCRNGAVVKVTGGIDADTIEYSILLGDATLIQEGAQYPNVLRLLNPGSDEHTYYDTGGLYPWPGATVLAKKLGYGS